MILNPTIAFVPLACVSGVYIVVIVTSSNFILLSFISLINSLDTPYPCDTTSIFDAAFAENALNPDWESLTLTL